MFVEQRYVLARAKLHFTPVVLTPQAHLQRVEGSKTLSPIAPLGRESNSLAESGVLLEFHPDKQRPDVSEEEAEQHLQRFIDIDQAWKILSNEESRNEYNLQLRACELKQSWPVDAHITLDDMNWDYETECYSYTCRCGGEFILEKDETQEVETVVCCDSCSLSIEVKKVGLEDSFCDSCPIKSHKEVPIGSW
ncbi:dnaJ homolog subfamily C member 24 isoform X2 [Danio rerio]|uniref:DnaJ homolog subfamily C member 24 isoform X2 n=1 Tax=Danio rerio TaxID=7955 RepID=A0AC58IUQ0_DANRE